MKPIRVLAAALFASIAVAGVVAPVHAGVNVDVIIGVPGVYVAPAPVYRAPYPVYVQPYPGYVHPAPVYVQPYPGYIVPGPVYRQPRPVYQAGHGYHRWQGHPAWRGHRGIEHRGSRHRDFDRDGVPNYRDGDRDGDGVTNRHDRRPNNASRY